MGPSIMRRYRTRKSIVVDNRGEMKVIARMAHES